MREIKERYCADEAEELDGLIRNSYNEFARLERRNLLLISSATLIAAISGLHPENASALGFSFKNLSPGVFYGILVVLTVYFLAAFSIYSVPTYKEAKKVRAKILSESCTLEYSKPWYAVVPPNISSDGRYYSWIFLHYALPIIVGIISCFVGVVKMF